MGDDHDFARENILWANGRFLVEIIVHFPSQESVHQAAVSETILHGFAGAARVLAEPVVESGMYLGYHK